MPAASRHVAAAAASYADIITPRFDVIYFVMFRLPCDT